MFIKHSIDRLFPAPGFNLTATGWHNDLMRRAVELENSNHFERRCRG